MKLVNARGFEAWMAEQAALLEPEPDETPAPADTTAPGGTETGESHERHDHGESSGH